MSSIALKFGESVNRAFIFPDRRNRLGFLWIIFVGYCIAICYIIPKHEPWFDEAQGWLLARDLSPWQLIAHYSRYEGSPALWHFALMGLVKLGLPYQAMNIFGASMAALGVWLLMRFSPLPFAFKAALPFTYYLSYQYAVIARSYTLLPPALYWVAMCRGGRDKKPIKYIFSLIILSQISLHSALLAGGLIVAEVDGLLQKWKNLTANERMALTSGIGIFFINTLYIIWQLWPPCDLGTNPRFGHDARLVTQRILFYAILPFGHYYWKPILLLFTTGIYFYFRQILAIWLLPFIMVLIFMALFYNNLWHSGVLFCWMVFGYWIAGNRASSSACHREPWLHCLIAIAVLPCIVSQFAWSVSAYAQDSEEPYSGSKEAAAFLNRQDIPAGQLAIYGKGCRAILPYINKDLLAHRFLSPGDHTYWWWSKRNQYWNIPPHLPDGREEYFIQAEDGYNHRLAYKQQISGDYHLIGTFEGNIFWEDHIAEKESFYIWKRNETK